jgi:hypothetical protein
MTYLAPDYDAYAREILRGTSGLRRELVREHVAAGLRCAYLYGLSVGRNEAAKSEPVPAPAPASP